MADQTRSAASTQERDVQRLCDDYEKLRRAAEQLLDYVPTEGATLRAGYGNARANLKGLLDGSL